MVTSGDGREVDGDEQARAESRPVRPLPRLHTRTGRGPVIPVGAEGWRRGRERDNDARGGYSAAGEWAPPHTHRHGNACAPTAPSPWTGTGTGSCKEVVRGRMHHGRLWWRLLGLGRKIVRRYHWPHVLADEHCNNSQVSTHLKVKVKKVPRNASEGQVTLRHHWS